MPRQELSGPPSPRLPWRWRDVGGFHKCTGGGSLGSWCSWLLQSWGWSGTTDGLRMSPLIPRWAACAQTWPHWGVGESWVRSWTVA